MRFQACSALVVLSGGLAIGAPSASAGTDWQWTHQGEGEGWAHVFDGGPVEFDSDSTASPDDYEMWFGASDWTGTGSLGAGYGTSGYSSLFPHEERLRVNFDFSTSYGASTRVGAVRPGGEGHGWTSSVVEFVMPVDELRWSLFFLVEELPGFEGSMHYLVENVTHGSTLLDLTEGELAQETTLSGHAGDLIRMSFEASGAGRVEPGVATYSWYDVVVRNDFTIAEPGSLALLVFGVLAALLRRRRRAGSVRGSKWT